MASKTQWVEGLRGLAALQVMTHHIIWVISPWLLNATTDGKVTLLQLPVIRIFCSGGFSIDEFVIIAAYVSAIKSIKLSRGHEYDAAMSSVAKSAFKRIFRLFIPVIFVTTFAWLLCQVGAFSFSHTFQGSWWLRDTSPAPSAGFLAAVHDLFVSNFNTLYNGANFYEKNFWVMRMFLQASFYSYTILFSTNFVRPKRRYIIYAILYAYCYATFDQTAGTNTCIGIALAELHQATSFQNLIEKKPMIANAIAAPLIGIGLLFASYPLAAETAQWSKILLDLGNTILPTNGERVKYFTSIGAQLIIVGLSFTTNVQSILAHPWLVKLGKVSWPLYLIHGTCIRTIFVYVLYGIVNNQRAESAQAVTTKEIVSIAIILPFFYALVYWLAHLWGLYVDPICDKLARCMEEKVFLHDTYDTDGTKEIDYMLLT